MGAVLAPEFLCLLCMECCCCFCQPRAFGYMDFGVPSLVHLCHFVTRVLLEGGLDIDIMLGSFASVDVWECRVFGRGLSSVRTWMCWEVLGVGAFDEGD